MMNNILKQSEDSIDLRALLQNISTHKILIIVMTSCITLLGVVYTFAKTPTYEVKAILEIGSYRDNTLLETPLSVIKKLEISQQANKSISDEGSLDRVIFLKGSENLLELVVIAPSNEKAIKKLEKILSEIKERHQNLLNAYITQIYKEIKRLEEQREELRNEKQALMNFITHKTEILEHVVKDNLVVAVMHMINLNNKSLELSDIKMKIFSLDNQIKELEFTVSSNNIKSTGIIDQIMTNNESIKPRKAGIIAITFISGFIFSLFITFFLTLQSRKND